MRQRISYDPVVAGHYHMVAKIFEIPYGVLAHWQQAGFLSQLITPAQWELLNLVRCAIWDNRKVLRAMLGNLPRSERRRLLDSCQKSAIERIVYFDFLRVKLTGCGLMNDGRLITYIRYQKYLGWRHPNMLQLLTRQVFDRQRKAAEVRIRYCRQHGTLPQLIADLGLEIRADGTVVNTWISSRNNSDKLTGRNIFHD